MINKSISRLLIFLWITELLCIFVFSGCQEQTSTERNMNFSENKSEQEFQKQSNRPPTSKTLYTLADIFAAQGKDTECEFILKRIISEYPKYLPAYNSLAELQMRQGRINEAIDTIYDAFRINEEEPLLLNNLGVCWIICGQYDKALDIFTKATGMEPENTRYRMNMALALGLLKRYEESLSLYKQVLPEEQAENNLSVLHQTNNELVSDSTYSPSDMKLTSFTTN